MSAKDFLREVGAVVNRDFLHDRSILSFEEYLELFLQSPRLQSRNSAQYLLEVMDHFGTTQVSHPAGPTRRFKLFDLTDGERAGRVAGQEEVQNALYRLLGNFVRAGAVNKLVLLHGPNGSAKSTIVDALKRGMEMYSREPEGALYEVAWIFPSDKLVKGSEADWVYFPDGSLTKFKTVSVEEFDHTGHGDSRDAARDGKDYMEQWLNKQGFKVVKSGGDMTVSGNVFNAWEPHGAARYWGGWAANPGVGLELLIKANGKVVGEMRHKAKGSTIRDAVENGLEDMAKDIGKSK